MGSITETGGDAHVTGQNTPSVSVCGVSLCVCVFMGWQSACWPDVILNRCVLVTVSGDHVLLLSPSSSPSLSSCLSSAARAASCPRAVSSPSVCSASCPVFFFFFVFHQVVFPSLRSDSSSCRTLYPSPQVHPGYTTVPVRVAQLQVSLFRPSHPSIQPGTCRHRARGSRPALRVLLCVCWTVTLCGLVDGWPRDRSFFTEADSRSTVIAPGGHLLI